MRAFTLIEALLTVAIVSMAVAVGAGALSGASEAADTARAESAIVDLDRRGRQRAQRVGPVELWLLEDRAVLRKSPASETIASERFAQLIRVEFLDPRGEALDCVRFGRDGRSPDYRVAFLTDGRRKDIFVTGATGLMREDGP